MSGIRSLILLFQSFWLWSVIYQDIILKMKCFNQLDICYADRHTEKQHVLGISEKVMKQGVGTQLIFLLQFYFVQ